MPKDITPLGIELDPDTGVDLSNNQNEKSNSAIIVVLIAGLFWSFGPLVVRNIDDAHLIPWQYLFLEAQLFF